MKIVSCFFIPVCPRDQERVVWTVNSVRKYCRDYFIYVLADGDRSAFPELSFQDSDVEVVFFGIPTNGHWGRIWQMQNDGMRRGLDRKDLAEDCIFVRLDADALIVRSGFVARARRLLAEKPECGLLGQVLTNLAGHPNVNRGWVNYFSNRATPFGLFKTWGRFLTEAENPIAAFKAASQLRILIHRARDNGYTGAQIPPGAYVLHVGAIRRMAAEAWLQSSPMRRFSNVQDDVIMSLHVYAVGYKACDDIGEDVIFAICGKEPWINALELKRRGNYIIHPTKYGISRHGPKMTEKELVEALIND